MRKDSAELAWGVERRLEFIEFRLYWEGRVNRGDIMETFGVSVPQASKDLTLYQERAPGNAIYDKSAKRYIPSEGFQPRFTTASPDAYLSQLRSVADGFLEPSAAWIGDAPPFDAASTPFRAVSGEILRSVLTAIRRRQMLEIKYQSLSRPEPRWRWIAPHAIAFDGFRWHARAFCDIDKSFKDFLLSRMLATAESRHSDIDNTSDQDWQQHVVLEIGPHPDLSELQKKVIELDYGMRDGKTEVRVRRAFLYYTLKRLGLDTDTSERRPQDQQIVLLNAQTLRAH
ncbi:WYL domain-containing protein [Pelagibius sp. 7325]|uniref:WYL domain-containing protein n=1 Tax=Pelagibius sp. 7325 TaxID=3131994 RepID=UPI0030EC7249